MKRTWLIPQLLTATALFAAQTPAIAGPDDAARTMLSSAKFKVASQSIAGDYDRIVRELIKLTQTPAPPFGEIERAKLYMQMLREAGLSDVQTDPVGNVFGYRRGTGGGPLIVIAAHLDTVFPKGTDTTVKREGNRLSAPGIGDDTANLAAQLGMIRAMNAAHYQTKGDILVMGDVGEEGLGDVRGIRYLFEKSPIRHDITYFISFDEGDPNHITDAGTGVKRYKVTFHGPGGHSYDAFGIVNPAFAMADAMTRLGRLAVPTSPKTTYSIGVVEGGTSVNTIPSSTAMTVDLRSESQDSLDREDKALLALLPQAVATENAARDTSRGAITYEAQVIGLRPAGRTPSSSTIWQTVAAIRKAAGFTPTYAPASGDANIPMSLGVQSLTMGGGFRSEHPHSPDEFLTLDKNKDVRSIALAMASVLLLVGGT